MYTITVRYLAGSEEKEAAYSAPEYEVKNGVMTLAVDNDHDLVLPLFHVAKVDIQRHE